MKIARGFIAGLAGLCLLFSLLAFFLPDQNGMALSYLTILLAAAVGVLCIGGMIQLLHRRR